MATGDTTTSSRMSTLTTTLAVNSLPTSASTMVTAVATGMSARAQRSRRRCTCEAWSACQVAAAATTSTAMRPPLSLPARASSSMVATSSRNSSPKLSVNSACRGGLSSMPGTLPTRTSLVTRPALSGQAGASAPSRREDL